MFKAYVNTWGGSAQLTRRKIDVGSVVTMEDPTCRWYGYRGTVIEFHPDKFGDLADAIVRWPNGTKGLYRRHEIRDVRDRPSSAQIGFGAVWDTEETE